MRLFMSYTYRLNVSVSALAPAAGGRKPPGKDTLNLPDLPNEPSMTPASPAAVVTCAVTDVRHT